MFVVIACFFSCFCFLGLFGSESPPFRQYTRVYPGFRVSQIPQFYPPPPGLHHHLWPWSWVEKHCCRIWPENEGSYPRKRPSRQLSPRLHWSSQVLELSCFKCTPPPRQSWFWDFFFCFINFPGKIWTVQRRTSSVSIRPLSRARRNWKLGGGETEASLWLEKDW